MGGRGLAIAYFRPDARAHAGVSAGVRFCFRFDPFTGGLGEPKGTGNGQCREGKKEAFCFHVEIFFKCELHLHFPLLFCDYDRDVTKPEQFRDENAGWRDESKRRIRLRRGAPAAQPSCRSYRVAYRS